MKKIQLNSAFLFKATILLVVPLLIATLVALLYSLHSDPNIKVLDYVSPISTLVIAILTVSYVFTTNKQLSTMRNQLLEMQKSRELINQPLPVVTPHVMTLEKPRFFFSPPEKEYSALSRYKLECSASNHSSSPAVCVHICACINVGKKGEVYLLKSAAQYISVAPEKVPLASNEKDSPRFLFSDGDQARLIELLFSDKLDQIPYMHICTVYKNILGAAFHCRQRFNIYMHSAEQYDVFRNWYSNIISFNKTYSNEIGILGRLFGKDNQGWHAKFDEVKQKFSETIASDNQIVDLRYIPGFFHLKTITDHEYADIVSCSQYTRKLGPIHSCLPGY
jgi:hypothetical protein